MDAAKNNSGAGIPGENPASYEKRVLRKKMREICLEAAGAAARIQERTGMEKTAARLASEYNTIFAFISVYGEPDTSVFIKEALKAEKTVLVPRINGKNMDFLETPSHPENLKPNKFGIPEPDDGKVFFSCENKPAETFPFPALILVPGSAFTKDGKRLGRGGGYYDRFLEVFRKRFSGGDSEFKTAGFCFPEQIISGIPFEGHDAEMDCLVLSDGSIFNTDNSS